MLTKRYVNGVTDHGMGLPHGLRLLEKKSNKDWGLSRFRYATFALPPNLHNFANTQHLVSQRVRPVIAHQEQTHIFVTTRISAPALSQSPFLNCPKKGMTRDWGNGSIYANLPHEAVTSMSFNSQYSKKQAVKIGCADTNRANHFLSFLA